MKNVTADNTVGVVCIMEQVVADVSSAESKATRHLYECVLYYLVVFNLNAFVVYSFCSLAFTYFLCRQKVPKSFALGKNLHKRPLLRPQNVSLRSGACSSLQAFVCFQGAAELAPCGYFEIIYIRITLKHPRTMA